MNMRVRNDVRNIAKTCRVEEGMQRYGLGREMLKQTAIKANAVIKIGKCFLINIDKMDQYMDKLTEEEYKPTSPFSEQKAARKEKAKALKAEGMSVEEIAKEIKVSRNTVYVYLRS